MRAFVAVEFDPEIRSVYASFLPAAERSLPRLRWVAPANLHLTLQFLGEADSQVVADLHGRVAESLLGVKRFEMRLGRAVLLGHRRVAPRVLSVGLETGEEELRVVCDRVIRAAAAIGFEPPRRRWSPHVTLARNPRGLAIENWEEVLNESGLAGCAQTVENVALLHSTLRPGVAPRYDRVWCVKLEASE